MFSRRPWDVRLDWKLSFILQAREVAESCLSLDVQAKALWGREFTTREFGYLSRLTKIKTSI